MSLLTSDARQSKSSNPEVIRSAYSRCLTTRSQMSQKNWASCYICLDGGRGWSLSATPFIAQTTTTTLLIKEFRRALQVHPPKTDSASMGDLLLTHIPTLPNDEECWVYYGPTHLYRLFNLWCLVALKAWVMWPSAAPTACSHTVKHAKTNPKKPQGTSVNIQHEH